ncbi:MULTISPECIES: HPF/RaiA family ribosome-associated protein [Ramlibacter]|uniref:HPF/RaiA family ribosome-associated protein n=1 Tax=Ramlibacter aquaticus TaxID=2780094 RepID=A0ABR9S9H6_9BURK|nr:MULTISPECIES: HPF/RaiA family ribosome-associated protein [Ramlibacter]MBE7939006.1 HPF/RaiA family ribosome-associated protein [Ramlibacter aquaticus]
MQILVNTGSGAQGDESLERWADGFLQDALARFRQALTRVELQLAGEHPGKGNPQDRRCTLEARLNGHAPVVVHHDAPSQDLAIRGASDKLIRALDHALGKLDRHDHRDRETLRRDLPTDGLEV